MANAVGFGLTGIGFLAYSGGAIAFAYGSWPSPCVPRPVLILMALSLLGFRLSALVPNAPASLYLAAAPGWIALGVAQALSLQRAMRL